MNASSFLFILLMISLGCVSVNQPAGRASVNQPTFDSSDSKKILEMSMPYFQEVKKEIHTLYATTNDIRLLSNVIYNNTNSLRVSYHENIREYLASRGFSEAYIGGFMGRLNKDYYINFIASKILDKIVKGDLPKH